MERQNLHISHAGICYLAAIHQQLGSAERSGLSNIFRAAFLSERLRSDPKFALPSEAPIPTACLTLAGLFLEQPELHDETNALLTVAIQRAVSQHQMATSRVCARALMQSAPHQAFKGRTHEALSAVRAEHKAATEITLFQLPSRDTTIHFCEYYKGRAQRNLLTLCRKTL